MGVSSNSKVFLFDQKDPKGNMETHNNEVCQSQTSIQEDHKQLIRLKKLSVQERDPQEEDYNQEEQKQSEVTKPFKLKLEIPSHVRCEDVVDDGNDGFKTPTSSDHKIPVITECPGAPRKQIKSRPVVTKRKAACPRRFVFDLCKELESFIPTPYGVDLGGDGMNSNKRLKHC